MKYQFVRLLLPDFRFIYHVKHNKLSLHDLGMTRAITSTILERF